MEIETRLLGWDSKWGFIEHRFIRDGRVIGVVAVRGVFKGTDGPIDPGVFLAELSHSQSSPSLPQWANDFQNGCESMSRLLRNEEASRTAERN